jgi:hypothetical protein
MEVHTTILCNHLPVRSFYLFRLVVKLVSLSKRVTLGHAPEAANSLEIFRELRYGVGHQLVQLRLELEQKVSQSGMRRHA